MEIDKRSYRCDNRTYRQAARIQVETKQSGMKELLFVPSVSNPHMTIVCFVSGSGTNYREIVKKDPHHRYIVFTNRPGCGAEVIAKENHHHIIELSHIPFLLAARNKYGAGLVPRNCPERVVYEREAARLIEEYIGGRPDLICMAGYDQWTSDWLVDRYYPNILNVHPGDTTKGYDGLHWIPSAKAIIAGDDSIRSTLFIVDKGEDTGPVLVQSRPLSIFGTLKSAEATGHPGLLEQLCQIKDYLHGLQINSWEQFQKLDQPDIQKDMETVCTVLQDALKAAGDWEIYPFAVHDLIARGRVAVDGRTIYVDDKQLPSYGYRLDEQKQGWGEAK
jgi:folate-dependent phosphoribosylglycinamide formyltransferase PurN